MRYTTSRYVMCLGGLEFDEPEPFQCSERMPWAQGKNFNLGSHRKAAYGHIYHVKLKMLQKT